MFFIIKKMICNMLYVTCSSVVVYKILFFEFLT